MFGANLLVLASTIGLALKLTWVKPPKSIARDKLLVDVLVLIFVKIFFGRNVLGPAGFSCAPASLICGALKLFVFARKTGWFSMFLNGSGLDEKRPAMAVACSEMKRVTVCTAFVAKITNGLSQFSELSGNL